MHVRKQIHAHTHTHAHACAHDTVRASLPPLPVAMCTQVSARAKGIDVSGRTDVSAGAVFLGCAELPLLTTLQVPEQLSGQARSLTLEDACWLPLQRREGPQVRGLQARAVCVSVCVCVCGVRACIRGNLER